MSSPSLNILINAYRLMYTAKAMADTYEANRSICKYVHSTSRGHEAIQLATAFNLLPCDFVSPYYRDESIMLGLGFTPYQLMLQLLAKADDIFTGGKEYYNQHLPQAMLLICLVLLPTFTYLKLFKIIHFFNQNKT